MADHKTKLVETDLAKILVISAIPSTAISINMYRYGNGNRESQYLELRDGLSGMAAYFTLFKSQFPRGKYPYGAWNYLGRYGNIKEHNAQLVIPYIDKQGTCAYRDYLTKNKFTDNASYSLDTLLTKNRCYPHNPTPHPGFLNPRDALYSVKVVYWAAKMEDWRKDEKNVFNDAVIFYQLKEK